MMPAGSKRKGDVSDSSSSEDDDEDDGAAVTRQVGYFVLSAFICQVAVCLIFLLLVK